jgi:uncharacterized MAPEG superfamily protein
MAIEFIMLALSVALGLTHVVLHGQSASLQRGYGWAFSTRDAMPEPLMGLAARLERAMRNYLETFTFFAASVMLAHTVGRHTGMIAAGSMLYFFSRLAYLPLYALGVPMLRSIVWYSSLVGIALIVLSVV